MAAPLAIRQPERGYRYSVDSVLLAGFAAQHAGETVLDLGTGCGVLLLLLARLCPGMRLGVGVEIQEELVRFARLNAAQNDLEHRLRIVHGDFREGLPGEPCGGGFDLVISNPPFGRAGSGRESQDPGRRLARHEGACTLGEVFGAAARHLAARGRLALVAPAWRLPELLRGAEGVGLFPREMRFVHPVVGRPANRVLFLAGRRPGPGLRVAAPLAVYARPGRYHPEVARLLRAAGLYAGPRGGVDSC